MEDTIDTLAEMGYDGIEIGAAAPHAFPEHTSSARRKEILAHVKRRGIQVSGLCPALGGGPGYNPASPDKEEREANYKYIKGCIEMAHDLECENVLWLPGWTRSKQPRQEAWNYAVEGIQRHAEIARFLGVKLAVEPTAEVSDVIEHAGDSLRFMEAAGIGPDVAGVMLDTIHVFYRGDDIREQINEAGDRLCYMHISDVNRDAPGTHTDFRGAVDELALIGYDGWLSMEVGFPRRDHNPDGITRQSIEYMRKILSEQKDRIASWRQPAGAHK
ncbi:protein FrlC [Peribacillus cavernae]|nr:protein FrlC [Peribacillus cavernae]